MTITERAKRAYVWAQYARPGISENCERCRSMTISDWENFYRDEFDEWEDDRIYFDFLHRVRLT